jgi:FkbM family methyltransferase
MAADASGNDATTGNERGMSFLNSIDLLLRRNASLPRAPWLRSALRKPYHTIMGAGRRGFDLNLAGMVPITVPVEYCSAELEKYETETVGAIADWVRTHPGGMFVDVGCSFGYFSCAVLFLDKTARVLAIDADLPSLEVTRRLCQYAPSAASSLELILGLIGPAGAGQMTARAAAERTTEALASGDFETEGIHTNYVCLDTKMPEESLPRMSLDGLLRGENREMLIKCDVEGAEQSVLEGARETLARPGVTLLVSVHPQFVHKYEGTVGGIRSMIESAGYSIRILGIDHEEHWLCQRD